MAETDTAPFILAVAPNGARRTAADHPALPVTPAEIARTAAACRAAGASLLHLHVRDAAGRHVLDADAYRAATAAVRAAVGEAMIVQVTTEAVGRYRPAEQMALVRELRPEAVSLAVRELIPEDGAEAEAARFLAEIHRDGTLVQYIVYDRCEAARLLSLVRRGIVPQARPAVLFVLGRYDGTAAMPRDLCGFVGAWCDRGPWAVCAFGPAESACVAVAAAFGGHGRVGFENNLWRPGGGLAEDNAEPCRRAAAAAALCGRPIADADAARRIMSCNVGDEE